MKFLCGWVTIGRACGSLYAPSVMFGLAYGGIWLYVAFCTIGVGAIAIAIAEPFRPPTSESAAVAA
ncbi:MAG TPA: hypothetical protein VHW66_22475 [Stellaceae bacterium]|jgi:hypothetical protein|nr:hypothetical protein [Stellaceae bacterium]